MIFLGLIPYFSLLLLFFALPFKGNRERFLYALILWGVYIFCVTELLSLFNLITFSTILTGWIIFIIINSIALFYNKNKINEFPRITNNISCYLIIIIIILSTIPLITGLLYPPNNYDSLTYHLPRIEHWIQNQSLAMYPTNIERQNVSSPFAEMILLHIRILSGNDIFYNSLQWLGYISCILLSSFIAKLLGAKIKGQIFSSLFCASISMAILQASSTQNDVVVSMWLISAASLLLLWYKNNSLFLSLLFGCSIGLACLTKGTGFIYGIPIVIFFGLYSLLNAKERLFYAACAGLCAFLILVPFSIRNYLYVQDIFGGSAMKITSLQNHSPNYILANLFCMIFTNFDCGDSFVFAKITELATWIFSMLHIDNTVLFHTFGDFTKNRTYLIHEDFVTNHFHFIFIFFSICFIKKFTSLQKKYLFLTLSMFLTFSIIINWQIWVSRLLTPFFILYAPLAGILMEKTKKFYYLLILILVGSTIHINIKNRSRPLSIHPITYYIEKREENYFKNLDDLFYTSYKSTVTNLLNYNTIGLIIGVNSTEFPLWCILHNNEWNGKFIHITKLSDINNCDAIIMFDVREKFGIVHQGKDIHELYAYEIPTNSKDKITIHNHAKFNNFTLN